MTPEWFNQTENSFSILVKVSAGAKITRLLSCDINAPWIKIAIASPPEKGKANKALLTFLAKTFKVTASNCSIASGHTSSKKRVSIGKKINYDEFIKYLS